MFRKPAVPDGAVAPLAKPQRGLFGRLADAATLRAHRLAVRLDWAPDGFGDEAPVDETDARAVRREWRRQLEAWAGYNPEQLFAIKVGGVVLALAVAGLLLVVAAF